MPKHLTLDERRRTDIHAAINTTARSRGVLYLDYAKQYLSRGDRDNALATAQEGLRLASGPFYLAVRDQPQDLLDELAAPRSPRSQSGK
jgi:hypothetical protein